MMHNRIIRYGVVPVNPLYAQIASTTELKIPLIGFHLLAVMINRINRTMRCPSDFLWPRAYFWSAVRGFAELHTLRGGCPFSSSHIGFRRLQKLWERNYTALCLMMSWVQEASGSLTKIKATVPILNYSTTNSSLGFKI